jgi:hypothetical protein
MMRGASERFACPTRLQVAVTDIDALWLRDPTPFFQRYPDADILTSSGELKSSVGAEEVLEKYSEPGSAFDIGGWVAGSSSSLLV